jgi:hypothetical protein
MDPVEAQGLILFAEDTRSSGEIGKCFPTSGNRVHEKWSPVSSRLILGSPLRISKLLDQALPFLLKTACSGDASFSYLVWNKVFAIAGPVTVMSASDGPVLFGRKGKLSRIPDRNTVFRKVSL